MNKEKEIKLSPPWCGYMQMLKSFFKGDDRIIVEDEVEKGVVTDAKTGKPLKGNWMISSILVKDADLAIALKTALARKVTFGNVSLCIDIVPANETIEAKVQKKVKAGKKFTPLAALKEILKKNPAFDRLVCRPFMDTRRHYCVFKPAVLQWYDDNLESIWKLTTGCHETLAVRMFAGDVGCLFCTAPKEG